MKVQKLTELLKLNIPYMLRNDGRLFEYKNKYTKGSINFHPYIIDKDLISYENLTTYDIIYLVFSGPSFDAIDWYYTHTNSVEAKEEIDLLLSALLKRHADTKDLKDLFNIDENFNTSDNDLILRFINLNNSFNQEFCRIRFSGKYRPGGTNSIWFRISSVGFNWFNLIWKVVYDNKYSVDTVNVCVDKLSKNNDTFYKINGKEIKDFITNDFLMLKGNPIIESNSKYLNNLKSGKLFYESLQCNSYYLYFYYNKFKEELLYEM